jgi:hypothetical protein
LGGKLVGLSGVDIPIKLRKEERKCAKKTSEDREVPEKTERKKVENGWETTKKIWLSVVEERKGDLDAKKCVCMEQGSIYRQRMKNMKREGKVTTWAH